MSRDGERDTVFVDLQGFVVEESFRIKEIAVLRHGRELLHHIFGPSVSWSLLSAEDRSRATWLVRNHHGLKWQEGDVDYKRARTLTKRALSFDPDEEHNMVVYVKGLSKRTWLEDILAATVLRIENIEDVYGDIGRTQDLNAEGTFTCGRHDRNCAMENVMKIHKWWSLNG